ncbi:hypothetical protein [Streptomyces sp. SAJ15]|uniref:hypothetical protein n=1 Tax=Streptomyces sp. SAJ15 TaxID=2011095 RepID=UPI0011848EB1|nr:hypothetical protein [Streptomyces sp. SAJ15]
MSAANVSGFEISAGNWATGPQASAAVQSTEQAHEGVNSLRITRSATASGYLVVCGNADYPVAASTSYILDYWLYCTAAAGVLRIDTDWYTAAQAYISTTTGTSINAVQNTWTHAGPTTISSPATAAFARPALISASGTTTGDVIYLDEVYLYQRQWRHQLQLPQGMNRAAGR